MTTVTISTPLAVREPRAAVWIGRLSARLANWLRAAEAQAPMAVFGINPEACPPAPVRAAAVEVR